MPGRPEVKLGWASRLAWALPALLGVLLTSASVRSGFAYDDYALRRAVHGHSLLANKAPFDLFLTISGTPEWNRQAREVGMLPWFASDRLRIAPHRPLAALSHTVDFTLWPASPVIMHLQNIALYAVVVVMAGLLFKRLVPGVFTALFAALLFACNDGHGVAVGWISCRSTLLAAAFGFLSLLLHDRWRSDGWSPGRFWGPLSLAFGLLSSELAIGMAGYLLAYAAWLDKGPVLQRVRSLTGFACVVIAWVLYYRIMDGGARYSGMYVDPWASPFAFAAELKQRAPQLCLLQFWNSTPAGGRALILSGLAALAVLPLAVRDKHVRFWFVGMVIAMVPACGTIPQRRMLLIAGLGGFAVMASVIAALFERSSLKPARLWWVLPAGLVGLTWIVAHVVSAPRRLPAESMSMDHSGRTVERYLDELDSRFPDRSVVLLNSANPLLAPMLVQGEDYRDTRPHRVRALAFSNAAIRVRRLADDSLVVLVPQGLFRDPFTRLFRSAGEPMPRGWGVELSDMAAVIVDPGDDFGPVAIEFRFRAPLESLDAVWVAETREGIATVELPRIGDEIVVQSR